jgi:alkylphosphonate utilization operon protein PhnA
MDDGMKCPKCNSEHVYQDRDLRACPEWAHEWNAEAGAVSETPDAAGVRDANGDSLVDGDSVIVIKDLKVKGSSSVLKGGNQGQEHPSDGSERGTQHSLQDRRLRRDESEIGAREKGLGAPCGLASEPG